LHCHIRNNRAGTQSLFRRLHVNRPIQMRLLMLINRFGLLLMVSADNSHQSMMSKSIDRRSLPLIGLIFVTLLALLPFIHKAIHIDDTLNLLTTQQILLGNRRPLDAMVNWYGYPMRLADVSKNPPTLSYLF